MDYATANPDSSFNLRVRRYELQGMNMVVVAREDHLNLSMSSRTPNYALSVVNDASQLVSLALPAAGLTLSDASVPDRGFMVARVRVDPGSMTVVGNITSAPITVNNRLLPDPWYPLNVVLA